MRNNNGPPHVYEALQWASSFFQKNGCEPSAAEYLMKDLLQLEGIDFHLHKRKSLNSEQWMQYKQWIERHGHGEPVQYITGVADFFGRTFSVSPSVLIPRPETEEMVDLILKKIKQRFQRPTIADIGTGSGAIAITLAKEWPVAEVLALDVSSEAVDVAKKNALSLDAHTVTFLEGDLMAPLRDRDNRVDVLVSNPPYITTGEWRELSPLIRDHEPRCALDGGGDGLFFYRKLVEHIPRVLAEDGVAVFEIGEMQGPAVTLLMEQQLPDADVDIVQDINGKDRFVFIER